MRTLSISLVGILAVAALAGCSSAESKQRKADAEFTEQRTEMLKDYQRCVEKAKGDEQKLKTCEALLKGVEATGAN